MARRLSAGSVSLLPSPVPLRQNGAASATPRRPPPLPLDNLRRPSFRSTSASHKLDSLVDAGDIDPDDLFARHGVSEVLMIQQRLRCVCLLCNGRISAIEVGMQDGCGCEAGGTSSDGWVRNGFCNNPTGMFRGVMKAQGTVPRPPPGLYIYSYFGQLFAACLGCSGRNARYCERNQPHSRPETNGDRRRCAFLDVIARGMF